MDVQPIGPRGSWVGLAAMNGWFHQLTGVHMFLYAITDWLELVSFGFMLAFALLVLCVMPTAMMQLYRRIRWPAVLHILLPLLAAFTALMVVGRLISGVHWLSDIIGSILLSAGLVLLYAGCQNRLTA